MPTKTRKPLLDDAKQREICAILSVGGTRSVAAKYVGCCVDTIRRTALRDKVFAERIQKAEPSTEITFLKSIQTAAKESRNWRAAAWALEHLFPERYARRANSPLTREQITEILTQFAEELLVDLPAKDREKIISRIAAMNGSGENSEH